MSETSSTNDDVRSLARHGATEGLVIVADHQTAGRGRLGRTWEAPAGSSLLVSILLRPRLRPEQAHLVATATACAAVEACEAVAGVAPTLKWPNDVVLVADGNVGGKLAGILAESVIEAGRLDAVIVGIGLNVNWPARLPAELDGIAVALNHVVGHEVDREDLLVALLQRIDEWCTALESPEGRARLVERYRASCATLGSHVRVELVDDSFEGVATEITDEGHLVVREAGSGARRDVVAGDVVHVRPG